MRQVKRNYEDKPRILTLQSTKDEQNKIANKTIVGIKRTIYSAPYKDDNGNTASKVIDHLNKWYFYKCAYCERIYKMDVEHYRPKGEVRDLNNKVVYVKNKDGEKIEHPGYYWLCYEWSNLLPSCISCNREGGKGSKFPTIKSYIHEAPLNSRQLDFSKCIIDHGELLSEKPYLLNPETDNLDKVFKFEIDSKGRGIKIIGADNLGRGNATIFICQMNRPEIMIDRLKQVVYPIRKTIISMLKQLSLGRKNIDQIRVEMESVLQKLYDDCNDEELSHTYLRKYIVQSTDNFISIVIPIMPKSLQKVTLVAFQNYNPL